MNMNFWVKNADEVMATLEKGRRVEGSLYIDPKSKLLSFNPYHRASRQPGYVVPSTVLYETTNGSLRQTARRNKIAVSIKRSLGNDRCAKEMMAQVRELTNYLREY